MPMTPQKEAHTLDCGTAGAGYATISGRGKCATSYNNFYFQSPIDNVNKFLHHDLSVDRLNKIQSYLWLTRKIVLDENIAMHWVWEDRRRIHLKPVPRYLMDSRFWSAYLICGETCACAEGQEEPACPRMKPYKDALGFLFSYLTLVRYESDFIIARDHSLFPEDVAWENWRSIVQQCLQSGVIHTQNIIPRYHLGTLRLSRLNKIYAIRFGSIFRGYRGQYKYTFELFQENLAPITAMTIYVALVLTAMQVGLATDLLGRNIAFQRASYGFTVFAILGPLVMILLIWCVGALEVLSTQVFGALRDQYVRYKASLDEILPVR
ncbi:hypothetical protein BDW71DRAFT_213610 [Aspergillus fruticulosus]